MTKHVAPAATPPATAPMTAPRPGFFLESAAPAAAPASAPPAPQSVVARPGFSPMLCCNPAQPCKGNIVSVTMRQLPISLGHCNAVRGMTVSCEKEYASIPFFLGRETHTASDYRLLALPRCCCLYRCSSRRRCEIRENCSGVSDGVLTTPPTYVACCPCVSSRST